MNQHALARAGVVRVPETLSTPEVAHTIGGAHGPKPEGRKHETLVEILEAILLAIVAVSTAWRLGRFEGGTKARETGDRYLRNTVLLATVLFMTALAQKFKVFRVRLAVVGVAACLLLVALYFVVTYPTA
jgi:hypothetical protein